jgi:1-phosphofructokinase family hexose kinase
MHDDATLVLTVTPNPSLDLLFESGPLVWDDANRMPDPRRRPGGQGINVTRAVRRLGGGSTAVALLAGATGDEIGRALHAEGTPLVAVAADGETRTFVAVREAESGRSMLLNARGPDRSAADAERLAEAVHGALAALRPRWLACCGSMPAGFPADLYARLAAAARAAGVQVVVDCDGEPLRLAAAAGCDLLVPNRHEAERLLETPIRTVSEAAAAARRLAQQAACAAVTLGAGGAVLARSEECWHAQVPPLHTGSAVGAGDAFLAGLLLALGSSVSPPLDEVLRSATAAGAATLLSRGTDLVAAADAARLAGRVEVRAV